MSNFLSSERFSHFMKSFKNLNVMVLGDIMLDEYHFCEVTRISPEAPVPVCSIQETRLLPGGAANVACNLAALGVSVSLCGLFGKDGTGQRLLKILDEKGISKDGLHESLILPTILKSRIVSQNQQILRLDRDLNQSLSQQDQDKIYTLFLQKISTSDVLILSDYGKGVLDDSFCQKVIQEANKHDVIVVVDPKGYSFEKYRFANIITPNFKEFLGVTKEQDFNEDTLFQAAQRLCDQLHLQALLITRSEKGMSLIEGAKKVDISARVREVSDVTGAGDTVVAFMAMALGVGLAFKEAAFLANLAAGIVVEKFGASVVDVASLQDAFHQKTYE